MEVGVSPPTSEDTAIVMYTSGSTGTPKGLTKNSWKFLIIQYWFPNVFLGVVLTHKNLVSCMQCLMFMLDTVDQIYIAYLPLAHVLELLSENTMLLFGIKVCNVYVYS